MTSKLLSSEEAVKLVKNGDSLATVGFVGTHPEELSMMLEKRFLETGEPRNLNLMYCSGQGDGKEKASNHYGHPGLVKRVIAGHYNLAPKLGKLVTDNLVEGYCLPQGCLVHLLRSQASRKPGMITHVGLKTFADPRVEGGKINAKAKASDDVVKLINIGGKEYLHYLPVPLNVAFIRGSTADEDGNISMEREFTFTEAYHMALATKNQGGIVICQVERMAARGSLHPQLVKVPGVLVDYVVVAKPENHMQNNTVQYDGSCSGEFRRPLGSVPPMMMSDRKVIARRCVQELAPKVTLNLGIGMPDGVSSVATEEGIADQITLTLEGGPYGGVPSAGIDFGAAYNPVAILSQPDMFDMYDGGLLDIAYLGLAETDGKGNVNVSKFGGRVAGPGGFINISQNAKKVVFCGTLTAGGLKVEIRDSKLNILQEGKMKKFVKQVEQITFSGDYAIEAGQQVLYITERAVFELKPAGVTLIEIAPGIDLQKHILDQVEFDVNVSPNLKLMDARLFQDAVMGIKDEILAK